MNISLKDCINENKKVGTYIQVIKKSGTVFLYLDNIYSLILASGIVIYLSFAIINGNLLK